MKRIISICLLTSSLMAFQNPFDNSELKRMNIEQINLIKKINSQSQEINSQKYKINALEERINGLTSIIEGLSLDINRLKQVKPPKQIDNTELIKSLGKMIDDINGKYVSKEEVIKLIKEHTPKQKIVKKEAEKKKETKKIIKKKEAKIKGTPKELYSKGVRLFYNQKYNEAEKRFLALTKKNYKPAAVNFFLGEISYERKDYENAIYYYKVSSGIKSEASYMGLLLYHTAYSLERTKQKDLAIQFYKTLEEEYTGKYSKLATKRLKDIE